MHRLNDRLARIEQQRGPTDTQVIFIHGGVHSDVAGHAIVAGETLTRADTEPFPAFQARALAVGKATREAFVVIGGLPAADPRETQLSGPT
jgi:hypothetical protein